MVSHPLTYHLYIRGSESEKDFVSNCASAIQAPLDGEKMNHGPMMIYIFP